MAGKASRRAHPFWSFLAWVVMSLTIVSTIAALLLESATGGLERTLLEDLALAAAFMAFAVVGALIASRHPTNAVGWIFLGVGLLVAFLVAGTVYARYGLILHPGRNLPRQQWERGWRNGRGCRLSL